MTASLPQDCHASQGMETTFPAVLQALLAKSCRVQAGHPWLLKKVSNQQGTFYCSQNPTLFFFFFLVCRSYSAVVHFWRNLDLGSQELKQLAPEERWKSFMEAAQILAKAFVAQDILSEGSTHETYQLLVAFTTMRDLNPMPLPLVDYFKFIR